MNKEAFVYLWYDSRNKMFYLGKHKGTPDDGYTHSSSMWQQFKNDNTVKLEKVDGIPYIQRGRQFFIIDYVEEIQAGTGKKIEVLKEIPVQPPLNLNSDAPAESFKRTK